MSIPHKQAARYNSLQEFTSFFKEKDNHVATTNLYSVHFGGAPDILRNQSNPPGTWNNRFEVQGDLAKQLDFYAKSVNLPSKQVTTSQVVNVGSAVKYATGSAFSQVNITFQIPRSQYSRNFFERWVSKMSNDANQMTEFYDYYVCKNLRIYKMERGGGDLAITNPRLLAKLRESSLPVIAARLNEVTACWDLRNVFPYNIGSIQLNSDSARVMELTVGFYYERYRFYTKPQFDAEGRQDNELRLALDNSVQPEERTQDSKTKTKWHTNQAGAWTGYLK